MLNSSKRSYDSQRGNKLTFGSFVHWTVLSEKHALRACSTEDNPPCLLTVLDMIIAILEYY